MSNPFVFKSELWIPRYTGIKAYSVKDFLEALKVVDELSIFYHMYINIFNYHNLPTFYPNSFSYWLYKIGHSSLAEKLSIIDPLDYYELEELRNVLVKTIEKNYEENHNKKTKIPFYFIKADREIFECGKIANNLEEFVKGVKKSSINSVFFHLVTSRINHKTLINDYSTWLFNIGEAKKAEKINKLNLYTMNLYEIKNKIIKILEEK